MAVERHIVHLQVTLRELGSVQPMSVIEGDELGIADADGPLIGVKVVGVTHSSPGKRPGAR